ncbi:MAG: hypothetical protein LIO90_02155 [Bacteroidales bacterium]|nr:hypothetical protein [Bacteroidales bacterium]
MKKTLLSLALAAMTLSASATDWVLAGGFNNWSTSATPFTQNEDGTYSVTIDQLTTEFKVTVAGWGQEWGAPADNTILTVGEPFTVVSEDDKNIQLMPFTVVNNATITFNEEEATLLVTGEEAVEMPALWITGGFCDWATPGEGGSVAMTLEDKVYTATVTFSGATEFKPVGSGWSPQFSWGEEYETMTPENNTTPVVYGEVNNIKADFTGTYLVTLDLNTYTISITDPSAIRTIGDDAVEGEAIYYNLQGVRVANPQNGLYIKVNGHKTEKVLVK